MDFEKTIRELINEGYISLARELLSVVEEDYPHLRLEIEMKAGNWKTALEIYEKLPEDVKKNYPYDILMKRSRDFPTEDYVKTVEYYGKGNYTTGLMAAQVLRSRHPEVLEFLALELLNAREKGDRNRAKKLEKMLAKIDRSHPLLRIRTTEAVWNVFVIIALIAILAFSIVNLFVSPTLNIGPKISKVTTKIETLGNEVADLRGAVEILKTDLSSLGTNMEKGFEEMRAKVSGLGEMVNSLEVNLEELSKRMEGQNADLQAFIAGTANEVYNSIKRSSEEMNKRFSDKLEEIGSRVEELRMKLETLESGVNVIKTKTPLFSFTHLKNVNILRILWIVAHQYYRLGDFPTAIAILDNVIENIERNNLKDLYFADDAYYYRALCYYEMGDWSKARDEFKKFVDIFSNSLYVPHAEYFIRVIAGE